jgi:UDP-glucuronate 4-epimerase
VRYSLENPFAYIDANVMGTLVMLEAARRIKPLKAITYASSSSVYGANRKQPFSVDDPVDQPVSLYAATKRSCELIARSYSHLYGLPATGLRFFTVYGPWGRPDMAAYLFTTAILAGEPIKVFNEGHMARDFTYIDDIVAGTIAAHDLGAAAGAGGDGVAHRIYNLGNHRPEKLLDFIAVIERALGRTATKQLLPLQPGDVAESFADIETARRDIRRHHHPIGTVAKPGQRRVALALRAVTMDSDRLDPAAREHPGHPIGAAARAGENDRALDVLALENLNQHRPLVV